MVIGFPSSPLSDQLFLYKPLDLVVEPKRIEFPKRPSNILSPTNGNIGCILVRSIKVPPVVLSPYELISVDSSSTLRTEPPSMA